MVAALTPLISGAISKTVNLPRGATVAEFKDVVLTSWELGIKGITLYRDSSKASQPLNTALNDTEEDSIDNLTYYELLEKVKEFKVRNQKYSTREKLIGIRYGTTHPAQIGDVKIYTTVNRRENGEISEIYITTDREGTIITGLLNSLSKAISVMLQYHVPPKDISKMLRGQKFEPYGFVQKHPYIKSVTSISDLISKIIDIELGDFSHCQVKPDSISGNTDSSAGENCPKLNAELYVDKKINNETERVYGYTCPNCSSTRMVRNGTCMVCLDCGSTTGCS
jgi:ribonucleoside-diphosphate reductase alpha chain